MRNNALLVIAAALSLAVGTVTLGSNMGFKITIPLRASWNNYVSLPYYNSYTDANSLFNDIPHCTTVSRWDNPSGSIQTWTGTRGINFTITPGEAYIVTVSTDGNWVVVGSHNPTLSLSLRSGWNNYISVPYHSTATNAASLFSEIPNCTTISRWDNPSGSIQTWTGTRGINFPLTPGEGLIVTVQSSGGWVPTHY